MLQAIGIRQQSPKRNTWEQWVHCGCSWNFWAALCFLLCWEAECHSSTTGLTENSLRELPPLHCHIPALHPWWWWGVLQHQKVLQTYFCKFDWRLNLQSWQLGPQVLCRHLRHFPVTWLKDPTSFTSILLLRSGKGSRSSQISIESSSTFFTPCPFMKERGKNSEMREGWLSWCK